VALLGAFGWSTFAAALVPTVAIGFNWKRATASAANVAIVTSLVVNFGIELFGLAIPYGITGGFNFQSAWTTGRIAGEAIAPGFLTGALPGLLARLLTLLLADALSRFLASLAAAFRKLLLAIIAAGFLTAFAANFAAALGPLFRPVFAAAFGSALLAIVAASFCTALVAIAFASICPTFPPVPIGAQAALVADLSATGQPIALLARIPAMATAVPVVHEIAGARIIEVVVPAVIAVVVIAIVVISGAVISGATDRQSAVGSDAAGAEQGGAGNNRHRCSFG
jgi:hypothetical protein